MRTADKMKRNDPKIGFGPEIVESECQYVLKNMLPASWDNEAAWAYIRGMLANSTKEAQDSLKSNARRVFIGELPLLKASISKMMETAKLDNFVKPVDADAETESIAFMSFQGLKNNRFLYATWVDICIAESNFVEALNYL